MKAMIFAAGLGTRLAPLTNNKPKALVEINGKPMLQMQIEKLINSGFNYIVINVYHFADQIKAFLNNNTFDAEIVISDESQLLLNTGGGLKNVKKFFESGDIILLHNVDIFSDIDLSEFFKFHASFDNILTMAVKDRKSSNYLLFDDTDRLCGWKSYKTGSEIIAIDKQKYKELAFSGIYVFNFELFNLIKKEGSFPIIPELLEIAKINRIGAWVHNNNFILDLGKPEAIAECERFLKDKS
ncbi:MAG TPA: sugar phosphate nucleotidyltransferase [Bacteroidales bacterium]|nr:sugar phosphate nucleotidyltransferase [Bacteroidales bacterium]